MRPQYEQLEWGRRITWASGCYVFGCLEEGTYWVTYSHVTRRGPQHYCYRAFCGHHFRRWMENNYKTEQQALFGSSAAGMAGY